ncbi:MULTISPECIES: pyridoxal 5'-phosphate synthase glutaminase subunit PdxT [unclassified Pseudoclavibacter]|uniref:pyridoxal 5'-phosphate synthase glutaminase subunit PdxT n=1 Tax=unclassified Pseudoclavibacter TaxID=2615177 RepID=UPI001BA8A24E|nr:pyridoxal 5'-phosphate synthase glutaminase subunit PdxT [Pseudoclavibacter sp. Marseille-Q4354]MBS3177924.1 pyridoxal 5'-phosphate synthase glutaminase subunit PdxT [Pseudoclavibacter sp. Marseille-Q4354]
MAAPTVGVLALQGDVREHQQVLTDLGAEVVLVRTPAQLETVAGLVIPGGESSVIDKLSRIFDIAEPITTRIASGMPVLGTCAGLIMLADTVLDAIDGQRSFGGLDVAVRRNAFGSQNQSFETELDVPELGGPAVHATFIRGPVVETVGDRARIMAALPDGRVVAVSQGNVLGTSFHPEMNGETRFHSYFLDRVADHAA